MLNEELKRSIKENENKISDEKITEVLSEIKKMSPEEVEKLKNKLNSI